MFGDLAYANENAIRLRAFRSFEKRNKPKPFRSDCSPRASCIPRLRNA
jgi:hypothetical protein